MKYKVLTTKQPENGQCVIIERLKNSACGCPRYNVKVILQQNGSFRGCYSFNMKGYWNETQLAERALELIRTELKLEALK